MGESETTNFDILWPIVETYLDSTTSKAIGMTIFQHSVVLEQMSVTIQEC